MESNVSRILFPSLTDLVRVVFVTALTLRNDNARRNNEMTKTVVMYENKFYVNIS